MNFISGKGHKGELIQKISNNGKIELKNKFLATNGQKILKTVALKELVSLSNLVEIKCFSKFAKFSLNEYAIQFAYYSIWI